MDDSITPAAWREFADRIADLRWERRQARRARRRARRAWAWGLLLSIPAAVLGRLGG